MNCDQIREELDLLFGSTELPGYLADHLKDCPACDSYWRGSLDLAGGMNRLGAFSLSEHEVESLVTSVEQRVANSEIVPLASANWMKALTRVAAAVFIVATSYTAYLIGSSGSFIASHDALIDTLVASAYDDSDEMDSTMVTVLIDQYSGSAYFGTDEAILGDLSEEELKYLEENFTVEDLL